MKQLLQPEIKPVREQTPVESILGPHVETHWGKRLLEMERTGVVKKVDLKDAYDYQTCVCGHQDPRIPRSESGTPEDLELTLLGSYFFGALKIASKAPTARKTRQKVEDAARHLVAIEQRATEVLAGL